MPIHTAGKRPAPFADELKKECRASSSKGLRLNDRYKVARKKLILFRSERGDDLLKARIAAQRIPKRQQFQLTIADRARRAGGDGELFAGKIFVANPRSDHRQILDHCWTNQCIFFYLEKLDCAPA